MPIIDGKTLILCVQAIAAEVRDLNTSRDSPPGTQQADTDELLLAYSLAASDLKEAYPKESTEARARGAHMPDCKELVGGGDVGSAARSVACRTSSRVLQPGGRARVHLLPHAHEQLRLLYRELRVRRRAG